MKRWVSRFGRGVLLAVAIFGTSSLPANQSPYFIEAAGLHEAAFDAFQALFPEITERDLGAATPVFFNCSAGRDITWPIGVENASFNCMATVNLDVSATSVAHYFADSDGNCLLLNPPGIASVHVRSDGSSRIHFHRGIDDRGKVVDCDEEVISYIARLDQQIPGQQGVFRVEPGPLLEIAFLAAIESFKEIPVEALVYGDGPDLSITCDTELKVDAESPLDMNMGPCSSSLMLANESVMLEYRYVSGVSCMIGKASDWIVVEIDQFGLAQTRAQNNAGGGIARGVKCDDEFFNSPLPLIENPDSIR